MNNHNWGDGNSGVGSRPEPCKYCGGFHTGYCSRIKKVEYHPDGQIKSLEFIEPIMNNYNYNNNIGFSGYRGFSGYSGYQPYNSYTTTSTAIF